MASQDFQSAKSVDPIPDPNLWEIKRVYRAVSVVPPP